jgi:hypothetical protein
MIHAVRKGKTKLGRSEDSLTSLVFQLLSYLPDELFRSIICSALRNNVREEKLGRLTEVEFWPKWDAAKIDSRSRFIEPDVFLRFENLDMIVEAKRYDEKGQYRQQWQNEFQAYLNEYPEREKTVILWALGGINDLDNDAVEFDGQIIKVFKSTWTMLVNAVQFEHQKQGLSPRSSHLNRIFSDLIFAFQFHGFFVGEWFADNKLSSMSWSASSLTYFIRNKEEFNSERWLYSLTRPVRNNLNHKIIESWKITI